MVLMSFFIRNDIFDQKKGACGKPPAGGKCFWAPPTKKWANFFFFARNAIFDEKKGACGKPPVGGKWFWLFWPKKSACGKPPAGGKKVLKKTSKTICWSLFWPKKLPPRVWKNGPWPIKCFFSPPQKKLFVPDLGYHFGYNRLSFWAGRRSLFFQLFFQIFFCKIFFSGRSIHF